MFATVFTLFIYLSIYFYRLFNGSAVNFTSMKNVVFWYISFRIIVDGTEEYIIQPTAWYYLKNLGESKLFLASTLAAFPVATFIFAPLIGMFSQKFQVARSIIVLAGPVKFIGNILYSIPINGYFPLFGRFISGIGEATIGVIYGVVTKGTTNENRARAFLYFEGLYSLGAIFGPSIGSILVFNVNIFGWPIDEGNSPAFLLATMWFLLIILSMFLPSDLTENSAEEVKLNSEEDSEDEIGKEISQNQNGSTLSKMCCLCYLVFLNMIFYNVVSFYTPLLAVYKIGLGLSHVKLIYISSSLTAAVLFITTYLLVDKSSEKLLLLVSVSLAIIPISSIFYFALMWNSRMSVTAVYLLLISMMIVSSQFVNFALASSLLSKITPTKSATLYQSIVFAVDNVGVITARLMSGATFDQIPIMYICFGLAIAWAVGVIWLGIEYEGLP